MPSQLQRTNYVIADVDIKDSFQLETFLRTQLGANITYNSMLWSPLTKQLTIFTNEKSYDPATMAKIQEIIPLFPNPEPDPTINPPENLSNPGEILTFDKDKNRVAVVPRGFPGQVLTCDPLASIGMRWRDVSNAASSGESSTITDEYIRYLEMYDSAGNIVVHPDNVHTVVTYNIERRKDIPTFIHDEFSGEFTVTEPGTYLLSFKVGLKWSDAPIYTNGRALVHLEVKVPGALTFTDIDGTFRSNTLLRKYSEGENSMLIQCIYRCLGGETFRAILVETTNTGILMSSPGLSSANAFKVALGTPQEDLTSGIFATNSGASIVLPIESPVDIPFRNDRILDSMFFTRISDTTFAVTKDAALYLNVVVGLETVGGVTSDTITYQVNLMLDAAGIGDWQPVTACFSKTDLVVNMDNVPGTKSVILPTFMFLKAGARLKLTATYLSHSGAVTARTIDGGSVFLAMVFASANEKYTNAIRGFNAYSSIAQPISFGNWTDVPINNVRHSHKVFLQNESQTFIQCSEPGTYYIHYKVTSGTTANAICNTTTRIVVNGGQGFFEALGCRSSQLVTGANRHSVMCGMALLNLGYNYQIKLQSIIRDSGNLMPSDVVTTIPYCSEIFVAKFEYTINPLPLPGYLVFGSHYQYEDDLQNSITTSTDFTEKLSLSTPNIPTGRYRISWYCFYSSSNPSGKVSIRLLKDDTSIVSEVTLSVIQSNVEMPYNEFTIEDLTNGLHRFSLQWKTMNEFDSASLRGAKIEIFRVT